MTDSKSIEEIITDIHTRNSEKLGWGDDPTLAWQLANWLTAANESVKNEFNLDTDNRNKITSEFLTTKPDINIFYGEIPLSGSSHSISNSTEQDYTISGHFGYMESKGKGLEFININIKHETDNPKPMDYMAFVINTGLIPTELRVRLGKDNFRVNMQDYNGKREKESIDEYILTHAKLAAKEKIFEEYQTFLEPLEDNRDEGPRSKIIASRIESDENKRNKIDEEIAFDIIALAYSDKDIQYSQDIFKRKADTALPNPTTIQIREFNENTPDKLYKLLQYAFKPIA